MVKWLKENWFKAGILCIIVLIGSAIVFYYLWLLPQKDKLELSIKQKDEQSILDEKNRQAQEECYEKTDEAMKKYWPNFGNKIGEQFRPHFNQKLNKCFVFIQNLDMHGDGSFSFAKELYNVLELKQYGYLQKEVPKNRADLTVKPFVCEMLDKYCKTDEEFDQFVKPYMED